MTVRVNKPAINVREELADLRKPTGIAGEAMLRAETPQEQFNLIGAGRRNLIINGDMRIDQRNNGSSITGDIKYGVDRFRTQSSNTSIVLQRVSDAPDGFQSSLKLTNGGTDNVGASYREVRYVVEGYDISAWDKNNQSLTLSFWVKSSLAGTYQGMVRTDSGTDYYFGFSFDLSADTWTKVERVIPPDSRLTLSSDNLAGMSIFIVPHYGTNYTSSASGNWQTSYLNVLDNYPQNWANTLNATFNITGVQLELGKVATPFEHRSYGEELAACQRYFERRGTDIGGWEFISDAGQLTSVNTYQCAVRFNEQMRVPPTMSVTGTVSNLKIIRAAALVNVTGITASDNTNGRTLLLYGTCANSGGAAGEQTRMQTVVAGTWVNFDAEL